uniref:hypothetical protein n=1 Tax=Arthrobacter alkaliphilus TaxID=369936 RepID=UPI001F1F8D27
TTIPTGNNGKRQLQNLKPAETRPPHTGVRGSPAKSTNQKIGINKLGTLLSSQTTDTPGTTQPHGQDRSGATFQTYQTRLSRTTPETRNHTGQNTIHDPGNHTGTHQSEPENGFHLKGSRSQLFRFSGGDSIYSTHPQHPTQITPQAGNNRGNPGQNGPFRAKRGRRRRYPTMCAAPLNRGPGYPPPQSPGSRCLKRKKGRQPNGCRPF